VERVVETIRRETLDHFLLFSERPIQKIVKSYVDYYNHQRPHQRVGKIPDPKQPPGFGNIREKPVLGGLHNHYYRSSA
jgi:hypothetical protein